MLKLKTGVNEATIEWHCAATFARRRRRGWNLLRCAILMPKWRNLLDFPCVHAAHTTANIFF